jgi:hypothetical protein
MVGGTPERVNVQVGIFLRCRGLGVTEQLTDDRKPEAGASANARVSVPQIVNAHAIEFRQLAVLASLPRIGIYVIAGQGAGTEKEKPRADLNKPWRAVRKRRRLFRLSRRRVASTLVAAALMHGQC